MSVKLKNDSEFRLKLQNLEVSTSESGIAVRVVLTLNDDSYVGSTEASSSSNENWLVAKAVLNAIKSYLANENLIFAVEGIKLITMAQQNVMMVLINMQNQTISEVFVGTCIIRKNEADAVARATLDALNRKISLLSI